MLIINIVQWVGYTYNLNIKKLSCKHNLNCLLLLISVYDCTNQYVVEVTKIFT